MDFYGRDSVAHFFDMMNTICEKGQAGTALPVDVVQMGFNLRPLVDIRAMSEASTVLKRDATLTDKETIDVIIRLWHSVVKPLLSPEGAEDTPNYSALQSLMKEWSAEMMK